MTPEEILQGLYDETLVGNAPRVLELTNEGLSIDMEPQTLLFDALIPSLEEVGARFERGDFFVPEMLIAGRAMAGSMEVLRPLVADTGDLDVIRASQPEDATTNPSLLLSVASQPQYQDLLIEARRFAGQLGHGNDSGIFCDAFATIIGAEIVARSPAWMTCCHPRSAVSSSRSLG